MKPDSTSAAGGGKPAPSASHAAAITAEKKLRHAAVAAAVLVVVGAVAGLVPRWQHDKVLRARTLELAVPTVTVVSPVPGKAAPGLSLPAEVKALVEAPIYARASGYVKRFQADIGAQVKEGDLLAEIDTPEMNQELAQARAELTLAEAAMALAKTTAARWTELVKSAGVSEQETAEKVADLELKTAAVESARANVHRLEDLQSFARVTAPFDGTITARGTDVGQLVSAGGTRELFRLAQTRTLRVFVRVPQTAAASVSIGQVADLSIPELPGRVFPAKVVRTSGALSPDSRTLLTELAVDNAKGEILSGSYAQVRFSQGKTDAALTLPANAFLFRAEGPQVGVVGADSKVELRGVTLGRDFGPTIEILGGLTTNDQVILNPSDSLAAGSVVRTAAGEKAKP